MGKQPVEIRGPRSCSRAWSCTLHAACLLVGSESEATEEGRLCCRYYPCEQRKNGKEIRKQISSGAVSLASVNHLLPSTSKLRFVLISISQEFGSEGPYCDLFQCNSSAPTVCDNCSGNTNLICIPLSLFPLL